jgi:hypothetical protein
MTVDPRPELSPYRRVSATGVPLFVDTRRVLRATQLTAVLAALGASGLFLPLRFGMIPLVEALSTWMAAAVALPILGLAGAACVLCVRVAWYGQPPLRQERRGFAVGLAVFLAIQLAIGRAMVRESVEFGVADVFVVVLLPIAALAAAAAWRCEGWEGCAYALAAFALAMAGAPYTAAIISGGSLGALQIGGRAHLVSAAALLLVAGWAMLPIARARDLATYAGMAALAVSLDSAAMFGLALLNGVHCPACDRWMLGRQYVWWANYFTVQQLLALTAFGVALPAVMFARQRRYAMAGLAVVMLVVLITPL